MPTGSQVASMSRFAGCRRVVYNKSLELQSANYAVGNKYIRYESLAKNIGIWRAEMPWLGEAPYHVLQQSIRISTKPSRISLGRDLLIRPSRRRAEATAFAILIRNRSSWTRPTIASSYLNWAGCAIETVARFSAISRT